MGDRDTYICTKLGNWDCFIELILGLLQEITRNTPAAPEFPAWVCWKMSVVEELKIRFMFGVKMS